MLFSLFKDIPDSDNETIYSLSHEYCKTEFLLMHAGILHSTEKECDFETEKEILLFSNVVGDNALLFSLNGGTVVEHSCDFNEHDKLSIKQLHLQGI